MPARRRGAAIRRPRVPESSFAAVLRAERDQARLTQEELGERVGTSQFRLSHFENGKLEPTIGEVVAMEAVFGLPAGTLLIANGFRCRA